MRSSLPGAGPRPGRIDDVFFGNANGAGKDNHDVARMAVLLAGLPLTVPGTTVNRLCGSGMEAVVHRITRYRREVLLQSAAYCGLPAANSAFATADLVLRELEEEGKC